MIKGVYVDVENLNVEEQLSFLKDLFYYANDELPEEKILIVKLIGKKTGEVE